MTEAWPWIRTALLGAGLSVSILLLLPRPRRLLTAVNYRGTLLDVTLGIVVWSSLSLLMGASFLVEGLKGGAGDRPWLIPAMALVFAGGLYDDLQPHRTRGIVLQLRRLGEGVVTPGVVKLAAAVAAAAILMIGTESSWWRIVVGIPVIAGSVNLWNLLDVMPGRAIKFFLVGVLFAARPSRLMAASFGVAAGVLWSDLRERAMLGDSGANVLGLIIGIGLFDLLSTTGLLVAMVLIVLLHVLSETITLSRAIRAIPPLRWLDDLGRVRAADAAPGASGSQ